MYHNTPQKLVIPLATALITSPLPTLAAIPAALEETVVTANYRPAELLDTVGSISVVKADTLRERAALHLQDILNATPNVTWAAGSSRSRFVQIRGVGDLEQFYDPKYYPSVGLMLDDLELGDSANAGMLFDVAQVEVLRGPQGTRFGASAHAGMINIRSNQPTDVFEGRLSAGVGNYDSYNGGLVLSGPLGDHTKGRVAVQQSSSDGYINNRALGRDDTNNFDELTARARLQWDPAATTHYDFSAFYFDADNGYDAWSVDNNRNTFTDQPGEDRQETLAFTSSGNWLLGSGLSVEATLSYTGSDLVQSYDADWVSAQLCESFQCSFGYDTSSEHFDRDREKVILDIRLLGGSTDLAAGEGHFVLGLYANDGSDDLNYNYASITYGDYFTNSDYNTERYAVYGEYEVALNSRLTLVAGVRLEYFEDNYSDTNSFIADNSDRLWDAQLSTKYALNDNTQFYLTVARGSKPGGVNTTASANQPFMSPVFQDFIRGKLSFDDETLLSTEIGLKTEQLDGRLFLSAALFYTDRENAQLENWMWDEASGLWISYLDSSSDTTSYGAELESTYAINDTVELFANVGWLQTDVDAIEAFDLDTAAFVTKRHREQAKAPQYQYNVGARVHFSNAWTGRIEVEGQDESFFGYYHDGRLDSYDLLNASLNWHADAYSLTLWGRNLSDEDYAVHGLYFGTDPRDAVGAFTNTTYQQLGEPRTFGIDLTYSF